LRDSFEWADAWEAYDGEKDGWFNIGHEAVGRHANGERRDKLAVRVVDFADGDVDEVTYGELDALAGQFINYLSDLGLSEGDRVATMLEPCLELYTSIIGSWLGGLQLVPLSPLFGPDAANYRLRDAEVKCLVISSRHYDKIDLESAGELDHVVVVELRSKAPDSATETFEKINGYDSSYEVADTHSSGTSTIQYTSGTTGAPKGVMMKHSILIPMYPAFTWSADHRPAHEYFGAAPPAWSYGLYGCTAFGLSVGMGTTAYRGQFDPEAFIDSLEELQTTNLFAPPTLLRQLSQSSIEFESRSLNLEVVATAGEPLDVKTINWAQSNLDSRIVDHYGFTEGAMAINNYVFEDWEIKPGSMGKPAPGFDARILDREQDTELPHGEVGEIAIKTEGTPFNATGYLNQPGKSEKKWGGEWLRTEDLGRVDEDGYFWFEGRADDVILSAGHRIGPTEVENTLMNHEAVGEAAVVGLPDEERGEVVAAFLVLADGYEGSDVLKEELQDFVKSELSKTKYPRAIRFEAELPKTNSGKIQRFKIRDQHD
jgi:acetyl-CoA synthetase